MNAAFNNTTKTSDDETKSFLTTSGLQKTSDQRSRKPIDQPATTMARLRLCRSPRRLTFAAHS